MKRVKKITLIALSIILILLAAGVIISNTTGITVGNGLTHIDDYNEFYLYKKYKNVRPFINFGTGGAFVYKVWIKPSQKPKLLDKIKEDINTELTTIVKNNSDILKNYKIVENKKINNIYIYIYYYKDSYDFDLNPESAQRVKELALQEPAKLKVVLYREFIYGWGNVPYDYSNNKSIDFIEINELSPK